MSSNAVVRPLRRYDADSSDLVCELLRDAQRARGLGPESSAELLGVAGCQDAHNERDRRKSTPFQPLRNRSRSDPGLEFNDDLEMPLLLRHACSG